VRAGLWLAAGELGLPVDAPAEELPDEDGELLGVAGEAGGLGALAESGGGGMDGAGDAGAVGTGGGGGAVGAEVVGGGEVVEDVDVTRGEVTRGEVTRGVVTVVGRVEVTRGVVTVVGRVEVTRGVVTVVVGRVGSERVTVRLIGPGGVVMVVDGSGGTVEVVVGTCRPSAPPASASAEPKPATTSTMPAATQPARRPPSHGARTPALIPGRSAGPVPKIGVAGGRLARRLPNLDRVGRRLKPCPDRTENERAAAGRA
jgi:hypothetical protein